MESKEKGKIHGKGRGMKVGRMEGRDGGKKERKNNYRICKKRRKAHMHSRKKVLRES